MILPGGGYMKGMQGLPGMSPLVTGLTLVGGESSTAGGSPLVVRRRVPTRPSGTNVETVAVNVRASMFLPSTASESTLSSTSTFGHGPKNKTWVWKLYFIRTSFIYPLPFPRKIYFQVLLMKSGRGGEDLSSVFFPDVKLACLTWHGYRVPKWWRHKNICLKLWDMMSYSYRGS